MAGNYFYDPRPFYGLSNHNLVPLSELFNGAKETAPWMDPRMQHHVRFDDDHHSHPSSSLSSAMAERRPKVLQREDKFMECKRPAVRNNTYNTGYGRRVMLLSNGQRIGGVDGDEYYARDAAAAAQQFGVRVDKWAGGNRNGAMRGRAGEGEDEDDEGYGELRAQQNKSANNNNNNSNSNNVMSSQRSGGRADEDRPASQRSAPGQGNSFSGMQRPSAAAVKEGMNVQRRGGGRDDGSSEDEDGFSVYGRGEGHAWAGHNGSNHSQNSNNNNNGSNNIINTRGGQDHHSQNGEKQYITKRFSTQDLDASVTTKPSGHREDTWSQHRHAGHDDQHGPSSFQRNNNSNGNGSDGQEERGHGGGHSKAPPPGHYDNNQGGQQVFHGGREESRGMDGSRGNGQDSNMQLKKNGHSHSVELKVPICCDNCERKVRAALAHMDDVEDVLCDQWKKKVTVIGNVSADHVLKRVRRVKKATELWQQSNQF